MPIGIVDMHTEKLLWNRATTLFDWVGTSSLRKSGAFLRNLEYAVEGPLGAKDMESGEEGGVPGFAPPPSSWLASPCPR